MSAVPGENHIKLGLLILEVNISCVKLQDSRPPQVIFLLENGTFFFQEYAFSPLQNFELRTLVPP